MAPIERLKEVRVPSRPTLHNDVPPQTPMGPPQVVRPTQNTRTEDRPPVLPRTTRASSRRGSEAQRASSQGNVSGTGAVTTKLRRTGCSSSDSSMRRSESLRSQEFAERAKRVIKVKNSNGIDRCWLCRRMGVDLCHVIAQDDTQKFRELRDRGLLNIEFLGDLRNGIALCGSCHSLQAFASHPGWFFIPSDMQYFFDYENEDMKRRMRHLQATGESTVRRCPSVDEYWKHQAGDTHDTGETDNRGSGGLYQIYMLRDWMHAPIGPYERPQSWHGDPMTTWPIAFMHAGSMSLPEVLCERLQALNNLYNGNDREAQLLDGIPTTARSADRPPSSPEDNDDVSSFPPSRATKQVYNAGKESASKSKSARSSKSQQTHIQTQTQLKTSQKTPSTRKRRFLDMDSDDWERHNECRRKRREAIEQQQRSLENWDHEILVNSCEAPLTLPNRESEELGKMMVFGLPPSHTTEDNIKTWVELNREDAEELSETNSF